MSSLSGSEPSPIHADPLATARQFAADVIEPSAAGWEQNREFPIEAFVSAVRQGLGGLRVPVSLGGAGLTVTETAQVLGTLAAADMGLAFGLVCHNNLAAAIANRGSPDHQATYLPRLLQADQVGAFLLTEPGAGSDAAAITTTARAVESGWTITGEKAWVTNASHAQLLNVYAQTVPGSGARGMAAFLVDGSTPGVTVSEIYHMLGAHSSGTGSVTFADAQIPETTLFIEPGQALQAALEAIDFARTMVAAMTAAMLRNGLDIAVAYVTDREAFGEPISDKQGVRWMLADVATNIEAADGLWRRAAAQIDSGERATVAAAHAKKFATRSAFAGLSECMQLMGANGFRHDQPLARHLAGAKMAHYLDGTTEIQNVVIARHLFSHR